MERPPREVYAAARRIDPDDVGAQRRQASTTNGAAMNAEISTIRRPDRIGPWSSATCRSQTEQVESQLTCQPTVR
jgi:hypothetical protein